MEKKRATRTADPDATSVEAEAIFAVIEPLIVEGATAEQKRFAVALGILALRLPHGQRNSTIQNLVAFASRRERATVLLSLVLSGEEIDIKVVADGITEIFEAAKTEPWILTQSHGCELMDWLRLLPFVKHPAKALAVVLGMPSAQRESRFLEHMVDALAAAPSDEAEDFLFKLAENDRCFYLNHRWRATALRLDTLSSARRILDLTAKGAFVGKSTDDWLLVRDLGELIGRHPELRAHVYGLLKDGPTCLGSRSLRMPLPKTRTKMGCCCWLGSRTM